VNQIGDEIIIIKRLKELKKSPFHENSPDEQKELYEEFKKDKKNKPYLENSLVMIDSPLLRKTPERSWQFKRAQLVQVAKVDFRQDVPLWKVKTLDGEIFVAFIIKTNYDLSVTFPN